MNVYDMIEYWISKIEEECDDKDVVNYIRDSMRNEMNFFKHNQYTNPEAVIAMLLMNNKTLIAMMVNNDFDDAKVKSKEINQKVKRKVGGGIEKLAKNDCRPEIQ